MRTVQSSGASYGTAVIVRPITAATTILQIKEAILRAHALFPGLKATTDAKKLKLYFSPVFITPDVLLGRKKRALLADTDTLEACQIVDDDVLYLKYD